MMRTLTPIFSMIIAVLLFFLFISPGYKEVSQIQEDTEQYARAVQSYNDFYAKVDAKLAVKRNENPVIVERLNQFIPPELDVARNIADLEQMATNHNLLFGNIATDVSEVDLRRESNDRNNSGNAQQRQELQVANISFDIIGTYEQLQSFLLDLESSLTLFEIIQIDFTASGGSFEQFSIVVRTYALPKDN